MHRHVSSSLFFAWPIKVRLDQANAPSACTFSKITQHNTTKAVQCECLVLDRTSMHKYPTSTNPVLWNLRFYMRQIILDCSPTWYKNHVYIYFIDFFKIILSFIVSVWCIVQGVPHDTTRYFSAICDRATKNVLQTTIKRYSKNT